jgi:glutamate/tyrosine decarboxylase-like PLP-dependent enzyme
MPHDPFIELLAHAAEALEAEFGSLPKFEPQLGAGAEAMAQVLEETAHRLGDNYPYFHPLYAGQMMKPPHPVARVAYALAMKINPNNHARDGGRASSEMEIEAVAEIAQMFGYRGNEKAGGQGSYLGHLTSSGTIANLEGLWVAGQLAPGKRIVASGQAHYTHGRISAVLKLGFGVIAADARGRMDLGALEAELRKGDVGTVVATMGTTSMGAVDPLPEILALRERYGFRVHADGAYGGYFRLIPDELDEPARRAFAVIDQADSIVVDPHKHGLQPYGCGCILFRDRAIERFYKHDSPATYFTAKELLHLGEISLECSRAGAAAVALWATQRLLPLTKDGAFAEGLRRGRRAALELDRRVRGDKRFEALAEGPPELDIVVWAALALHAADSRKASEQARAVFDACARRGLHLALVQLPGSWFWARNRAQNEAGALTCLRSVLMKPEHEAWMDEIWERLSAACDEGLGTRNPTLGARTKTRRGRGTQSWRFRGKENVVKRLFSVHRS